MRVGLVADIHANATALDVVLARARDLGVERLVVAGDTLGYYHEPARTLAALDEWTWHGTRGNHDEMVASVLGGDRSIDDLPPTMRSGVAAAMDQLGDRVHTLASLPHPLDVVVDGRRIIVCHGTPWALDEYVYPDADEATIDRLDRAGDGADLLVFGHTHYPVVWQRSGCTLVNPGSVGQPRDRLGGACWAMYDTDAGEVELRRETYDPRDVIARCERLAPNAPYLTHILEST